MDGGEERGGGPVEQVQRHPGKVREVKVRILYDLKPENGNLTAFLKICEVSLMTAFHQVATFGHAAEEAAPEGKG